MEHLKNYSSFVFAAAIVLFLILNGNLTESENHNYSAQKNIPTKIKFQKSDLGLNQTFDLNFPHPPNEKDYYALSLIYNMIPISYSVTDLNQDEFVDLCMVNSNYENSIRCYENQNGQFFLDKSEELGLTGKTEFMPSAVYSSDFNNDGRADLLVVGYGGHRMLLRTAQGKFKDVANPWFSNAWGANIYDFNKDGLLDIIFANYYARVNLNNSKIPWNYSGISDQQNGDVNEIWINQGEGVFKKDSALLPPQYKEHTTTIGIADYDRDGQVDIFAGNDFSIDRMYAYNKNLKKFIETTKQVIPPQLHGYSGMNSEFFDLNKDGYLDLFVSNIVVPPLLGANNLMWVWNKAENKFEQKSKVLGLDRCGYAWTTKAVDFDLDGENEIISASGFYTSENSKFNLLFSRLILSNTPKWFSSDAQKVDINNYSISTNSRPCLYVKSKDEYVDVSPQLLNWNIHKASRTLTLIDINNDGKMDLVIPEHGGKAETFLNVSEGGQHWVGIIFTNKNNSQINFGVKAEVVNSSNEVLEYFEFNPANGFKTQSDFRKVIGLGQLTQAKTRVYLDQGEIREQTLEIDKYNVVKID